jgi:hypothetical protein
VTTSGEASCRCGRSVRLWLLRRMWRRDTHARYLAAEALRHRYEVMANEAARSQMQATVELAGQLYSAQAAADLIGQPVAWVTHVIRVMQGMETVPGDRANGQRDH